jgi:hypothetical protein
VAGGGSEIDMIGAGAPEGKQAQTRAGGENALGEFRGRTDIQHQLGLGNALDEAVFGAWKSIVIVQRGARGQFRPDGAGTQNGRSIIGNIDFGCGVGHASDQYNAAMPAAMRRVFAWELKWKA